MQTSDKLVCKLCKRQYSKYTCPTCNVAYCSMICFRSESHSLCSELFYRKEIDADIRTHAVEERLKMLDLLKRFEEQNEVDFGSSAEVEQDASLAKRFDGIDFEASPSPSSDALWSMLTPSERNKFLKVFANPSSELAQELLAIEDAEWEKQDPWWETQPGPENETNPRSTKRSGVKPRQLGIPTSMLKTVPNNPYLIYNISAVAIAYAYTTRHLRTSPLSSVMAEDPDIGEMRRMISQLVPFLVDRRSKALYPSLSAVITDIWSRFDSMTAEFFSLLLFDAARLLRPSLVTLSQSTPASGSPTLSSANADVSLLDAHPSRNAILLLSDLCEIFENKPSKGQNHITLKLIFYAAHILSTSTAILTSLAEELVAQSRIEHQAALPTNSLTPTTNKGVVRWFGEVGSCKFPARHADTKEG